MDRFFVWLMGILAAAAAGLIIWCVVLVIQGPWYGSGTVVEKSYSGSYLSYCGKGCFMTVPECYRLKVVEHNGDEHTGCVSPRVWEDAMLDHHINLTPQYH